MNKVLYIFGAIFFIAGIFFVSHINTGHADMNNDKTLVAYFSATDNTKSVAEKLASAINAELFEIIPEQIYTDADLNWNDESSRTSVEMADRNSRPKIASKIDNMTEYKIIYLGFPIWWGREPSIIDTFMESYDFTDKTIIPFVTSGSSDIGNTYQNLKSLAPNALVLRGMRFPVDVSPQELKTWGDEQM